MGKIKSKDKDKEEGKEIKAGYVAIVGKPNVGKSTLINNLLNIKASIVSPKPQTTRVNIYGYTIKEIDNKIIQLVLIDTPGYHKPVNMLGQNMIKHVELALTEADVILMLIDASSPLDDEDLLFINLLKEKFSNKNIILGINKIDKLENRNLALTIIEEMNSYNLFKEIVPISAIKNENIAKLIEVLAKYLPYNEYLIDPQDSQPFIGNTKFFIAEVIREKILLFTHQELPYKTAVFVEHLKERKNNLLYIAATIFVEKESQRSIIIGKNGQMIKKIGKAAREELEFILKKKIYLDLWVKEKENWTSKLDFIQSIGY
jgi:GTP-binding protein Era